MNFETSKCETLIRLKFADTARPGRIDISIKFTQSNSEPYDINGPAN